jgi:hypothetical protein
VPPPQNGESNAVGIRPATAAPAKRFVEHKRPAIQIPHLSSELTFKRHRNSIFLSEIYDSYNIHAKSLFGNWNYVDRPLAFPYSGAWWEKVG